MATYRYELRSSGGRSIAGADDYLTLVMLAEDNIIPDHSYPLEIWECVRADRGEWELRETIEIVTTETTP